MLRLALLWHMHQPLYRNPVNGAYALPWTRLHALKDYYGMVKLVEEFPNLRLTFNLVPSLIAQIQEYAEGRARDPYFDAAAAPAESLDAAGREFLLRYFFQAHPETMIGRYPRYAELLQKFRQDNSDPRRAARHFSIAELRDLQVLSQLAWVDEFWLAAEPARSLAAQGRDFSREQQAGLAAAERGWIAAVLPEYRRARDRGQIEISATPYYHPILPLLCDTSVARECRPDVVLPRDRFRHPEDARLQLLLARRSHADHFGAEPVGLWPSEGSVSAATAELAAGAGFAWMASDEAVLARSTGVAFARNAKGEVAAADRLYAPHRLQTPAGPITIFFRDHQLSDLIGFVYSQMSAEAAADDFLRRLRAAAAPLVRSGQDALVSVILDGENAWEYFPRSGRAFLRALYARLTSASDLETTTFARAAAELPARDLGHLAAGSWIDANFDIWIGAEEDNRSWDLLRDARAALAEAERSHPDADFAAAREDVLAAEGSDWNWWYGPQHHSENAAEFDALYRALLSHAYEQLGRTPPAVLSAPIPRGLASAGEFQPASAWIHARIDGRESSYFEWMGAAAHFPDGRSGAMHGRVARCSALFAGYDAEALYLRLDWRPAGEKALGSDAEGFFLAAPDAQIRFEFAAPRGRRLVLAPCATGSRPGGGRELSLRWEPLAPTAPSETAVSLPNPAPAGDSDPRPAAAALGRILEVRVPRAALGLEAPGARLRLRAGLWIGGLPTEMLPAEGSLELALLDPDDLASAWATV